MTNLFVYGILRKALRGEDGATLLGDHTTDERYTMYSLGYFPGVVRGGSDSITGEVYEVTEEMLARCDGIEGYPDMYTRDRIETPWGRAWIYIYNGDPKGHAKVETGVWG